MYLKSISENQSINFTRNIFNFLEKIDGTCHYTILNSSDFDSVKDNVGWYIFEDNEHHIYMNVPNMLYASYAVEFGDLDIDSFYAFLTICSLHEYRHFLQGKSIFNNINVRGFSQNDALNSEQILFIRYFFDAYYLLNKGNIKYEIDAEKFSIENAIAYLSKNYPDIDAEKAVFDAVNFFAKVQANNFGDPTLPLKCESTDDILTKLSKKIENNYRNPNLRETLRVYNHNFYKHHQEFGLDEKKVIDDELLDKYLCERDGSKRDSLVAFRILDLLEKPEEALAEFPHLKEKYLTKCR